MAVATAVVGLLAIQGDQVLFGGLATHLRLELQRRPVHRLKVHRVEAREKWTDWGGIPAVGQTANPEGPALGLGELFAKPATALGPRLSPDKIAQTAMDNIDQSG